MIEIKVVRVKGGQDRKGSRERIVRVRDGLDTSYFEILKELKEMSATEFV